MPSYSKILLDHTEAPFRDFLQHLINKNFYSDRTQKISVKQMATDAGTDATKATKWLRQIYEGIFALNDEQSLLFQTKRIPLQLFFSNGDNHCSFDTSLHVLPREFESFNWYFIKAKVGTDRFWIKKVEHEFNDVGVNITLWLEGGSLNRYREYALDKALFQNRIHFMDVYDKHPIQLDDALKKIFPG